MTKDEMDKEIGGAFAERAQLTKKADCLRFRLRTYGRAFAELADSPFDPAIQDTAGKAPDLREDRDELARTLNRIGELNKLLDLGENR